jgi:type IV pilus assembly protein PilN
MIRINLLPHRAEKRKRRLIQFFALCAVSALFAAVLVGLGYGFMSARIFYQDKRNAYLKQEITKLEVQIKELLDLQAQINSLLSRKDEVEKLQESRSNVVHLLEEMLQILPRGVYLKSLKQTSAPNGSKIQIVGVAQSDGSVSSLMRAIENSHWFDTPVLVEIHSVASEKERVNEFSMSFNLKKTDESASAAAAPKAASAPAASAPAAAMAAPVAAPAAAPAPVVVVPVAPALAPAVSAGPGKKG